MTGISDKFLAALPRWSFPPEKPPLPTISSGGGIAGLRCTSPKSTPIVRPVSRPVVVDEIPEEYVTLARALNFAPTSLQDQPLDQLLQRLGIEVFDLEVVAAFLTAICDRLGRGWRWEWAPIVWVGIGPDSYRDPIPLRVLRRMHALQLEVPNIRFYVSRVTNQPSADPFLLAVLDGVTRVIDCWNEPGFRG